MGVENENDRMEAPEECERCGQDNLELKKCGGYGPTDPERKWQCPYCRVTFRSDRVPASFPSMFNELERRIVAQVKGEKEEECRRIANNILYLADNSDYRSALWEICSILGMPDDDIGEIYIEETGK